MDTLTRRGTESDGRCRPARTFGFATLLLALLLALFTFSGCSSDGQTGEYGSSGSASASYETSQQESSLGDNSEAELLDGGLDIGQLPSYTGSPYVVVAENQPDLTPDDANGVTESYAPLDALGRCDTAMAVVSPATMPTEERGSIGMVKPSGWHTVRYDDLVDGKYLYNRCHLIGYQLTAENANERNLITGTRYLNTEGMLPFENEVADYVARTGNRVVYRVTPVFVGDELVARGVHMEALSVEDNGAGVKFNVFCYNVQPGISIDYATGESQRVEEQADSGTRLLSVSSPEATYVLNTNTKKFHLPGCTSVSRMSDKNKQERTTTREILMSEGYSPCGICNP